MTAKRTEPSVSLLKGMPYTPSAMSDIRIRFAAIKAEQEAQRVQPVNVKPLRKKAQ